MYVEYEGMALTDAGDGENVTLAYHNAYSSVLHHETLTPEQASILRELIERWEQADAAATGDFPLPRDID